MWSGTHQGQAYHGEAEILDWLSKGFVAKKVGDRLGVSYDTIRYHLKHIYDKLPVHSRTEGVMRCLG